MTAGQLVALSGLDIALYTARSYTSKIFADAYGGQPERGAMAFSVVTGLAGYVLTVVSAGGLRQEVNIVTLLCGVAAGAILTAYNLASLRAACTGPYSVQSAVGMLGCVVLPLLFEGVAWGIRLTAQQWAGLALVICAICLLNGLGRRRDIAQRGYWGWVALLFLSNGAYSILIAAQGRWVGDGYRDELVASVFLSMAVTSLICLAAQGGGREDFRMGGRCWRSALLSAVTLTGGMRLLVVLLGYVNASVLYPVQNTAILAALVLISILRLGERPDRYTALGLVAAAAGIVALSM